MRFGWIHVTDLLMKQGEQVSWRELLNAFENDLGRLVERAGRIDAVFLTGDLTYSGAREDFDDLDDFTTALVGITGRLGWTPKILAVPGNHDCLKSATSKSSALLTSYWESSEDLREDFFQSPQSPLREAVNATFAWYKAWWSSLSAPLGSSGDFHDGMLPGDFTATLDLDGFKLGILGLNTAFLSFGPEKNHKGALNLKQANSACQGGDLAHWSSNHDFCVLVTHHHPDFLTAESQHELDTVIAPPGRFDLHVCSQGRSRQHMLLTQRWTAQGSPFIPSRQEESSWYSVCDWEISNKQTQRIRTWPRRYDRASKSFRPDDPRQLEADGGTHPVVVQMNARATSARSDETHELGAERVVVEGLELRNLRCIEQLAIDFAAPSTLDGDWTCFVGINGSGKSTILQALCLVLLGDGHATDLGRGRLGRMCRRDSSGPHDAEIVAHVQLGSARHRLALRITSEGLVEANGGSTAANTTMREVWKNLESRLVLSYGATRNLSEYFDTRYKGLGEVMQRQMTLFDPLTQVASAETLLRERPSEALRELVRSLMASVFEPQIEVVSEDGFLRFVVEGAKVGALELPDGYRSSAAWLCDLAASWYARKGKDLEAPDLSQIEATVLIDEIDLHLHPSLQRILVSRLRRALPNVQWFVSTHSPLILSSFDVAELVVIERDAERGVRQRPLDRQILGFTTDDVYRWLMGTPPSSEEAERKLSEVTEADKEEVRLLLEVSPEVNTEEARARLEQRRELLERLKNIKPEPGEP